MKDKTVIRKTKENYFYYDLKSPIINTTGAITLYDSKKLAKEMRELVDKDLFDELSTEEQTTILRGVTEALEFSLQLVDVYRDHIESTN